MQLLELKEKILHVDHEDDIAFQAIVNSSMSLLGLDETYLAIRFGCSVSSITRWMNGYNAPHPAMRKIVYNTFLDKILLKEKE